MLTTISVRPLAFMNKNILQGFTLTSCNLAKFSESPFQDQLNNRFAHPELEPTRLIQSRRAEPKLKKRPSSE